MATKARNIRADDKLIETADLVARGRGTSFNQLAITALAAEVARAKADPKFMALLDTLVEQDRDILERLRDQ